ncbi:MAG: polyprenol monophosphomannose synthase [Planctomycetaceae bacterium]|jgi:dolichol-phosphate mannosyltransferase|nr:polyprenol monophosphomannose synthase [Planctomycetaceae bacterium]
MTKLLVAIAAYNEMENIPALLDAVLAAVPDAEILVVDDDSPDGTGRYVRERSAQDPRIRCMIRHGKRGLGSAVLDAFRHAAAHDYDFVINMDADFSHPPEKIPELLRAMNEPVDAAIGSRYVTGGKILGWPAHRKIMSRLINLWAGLCLGLKTRDNSGAFRCYRVETLRRVLEGPFRSQGYSFFEEILYRLKKNGAVLTEIPITFTDRTRGRSKINKKEAVQAVWNIFVIGWRG